jgi:isopenicillin N synthase-like dioxygenase
MKKLYDAIPVLDLKDFTEGLFGQKMRFVQELGEAYENIGFVAIRNHGLSDSLQKRLYNESKKFFESEQSIKDACTNPEIAGQRGYIPPNTEIAKDAKVVDMKEFYQLGNDNVMKNVFPESQPGFKKATTEAFETLENTGKTMLRAIATYLGLEEDHFEDKVTDGNSIIRLLHYYPIKDVSMVKKGAVRAAEHGDINLITLLMGASADGLQVLRQDGKWIPITVVDNAIVVNIGDMMERYTNGKLKSTIHRVVNPENKEEMKKSRYSIPFFMHPKSEMSLACLENCVSNDNPKQYGDITAGEFLDERLREIGLKK